MISNKDMPAMPVIDEDGVLDCKKYEEYAMNPLTATGLTKREMFAMYAMQGLISSDYKNGSEKMNSEDVALMSVYYADELLAELERTK